MGIIIAVLLFSFIIIFHELGHFLLAKKNGIRVDEFSLGLGPTLLGKQIGETKFSLKLLPFGGACMMGEDDADDLSEGSFNSKSVWARMSVVAAGPIFNLILACVFCYFFFRTAFDWILLYVSICCCGRAVSIAVGINGGTDFCRWNGCLYWFME